MPIHFNTSLTHGVLHDEYDDDDMEMSHTVLAVQLLDLHMKTHLY